MNALEQGRESFRRRAWATAFAQLSSAAEREARLGAEREARLGAEDLERLATAAHLIGRESETRTSWRWRVSAKAVP